MSGYTLLIQHRTKPGLREAVQGVWRQHMQPAIAANEGHAAYFYCFGKDPDTIVAFQHYVSQDAAAAFLKTPGYTRYLDVVSPLLEGDPVVSVLDVQWSKFEGS